MKSMYGIAAFILISNNFSANELQFSLCFLKAKTNTICAQNDAFLVNDEIHMSILF